MQHGDIVDVNGVIYKAVKDNNPPCVNCEFNWGCNTGLECWRDGVKRLDKVE